MYVEQCKPDKCCILYICDVFKYKRKISDVIKIENPQFLEICVKIYLLKVSVFNTPNSSLCLVFRIYQIHQL